MHLSAGTSNHPHDFRFEREAGFPFWTLSLILRGRMQFLTDNTAVDAGPFDVTCLKPNTPYRTQTATLTEGWSGLWFIFSPREDWEPLLHFSQQALGFGHLSLNDNPQRLRIRRLFQEAHDLHLKRGPHATLRAMHAIESAMLLIHETTSHLLTSEDDRRIQQSLAFIDEDPGQPLSVAELAQWAGLSASRFAHLFRHTVGVSPMVYREGQRLRQARGLLMANELSIHLIATTLGYESPFHFSKRFKHHHGMSPRNFRQRMYEPGFLERWDF